MSISCSCDLEGDWLWEESKDFSLMPKLKRRKRCYSCKKFLNEGDIVLELLRYTWNDWGEEAAEEAGE